MITAVLDTNTIVSGTLVAEGISAQILEAARAQHSVLITSAAIIDEVLRTLSRERIQRKYHVTAADTQRLLRLLEVDTVPTAITKQVYGVATHPEDDWILATALSAQADYLVTGDRQLQRLGPYKGVPILSPRSFLTLLESKSPFAGGPG